MTIGIWILGDQLHPNQAALATLRGHQDPAHTPILMVESLAWVKRRNYHQQKIALVWSAMRHFAADLQQQGHPVTYQETDQFSEALRAWAEHHDLEQIQLVTPADLPFRERVQPLAAQLPCPLVQVADHHFLWSPDEFRAWAEDRKRLLMEDFYREGRKRFNVLMEDQEPCGGQWNFDQENRKPPKCGASFPAPPRFDPDPITQAVIDKIQQDPQLQDHFGSLESFGWAVSREQALQVLDHFVHHRLPEFGPLQDAMVSDQPFLWHALLSPYLNLGMLTPLEVIRAAETSYRQEQAPIACVEGFIRQILGWREYMRGLYESLMPSGYGDHNWFDHHQPLPQFFWDRQTDMRCLRQTLDQIHHFGYAHHIQRLMLLGNFALISGIDPQQMEHWFHDVFIDSADWVMQTNVLGMGLFADGGVLATKPYAASANYIHKMSDYCRDCRYNHNVKVGERACPFNTFYWDFLLRHRQKLAPLGRMGLVLSHLNRMDPDTLHQIQAQAQQWWQQQNAADPTATASHSDPPACEDPGYEMPALQ